MRAAVSTRLAKPKQFSRLPFQERMFLKSSSCHLSPQARSAFPLRLKPPTGVRQEQD